MFCEQQLSGWKCLVDVTGDCFSADKATVALITTRYNQGMQKRISESTAHQILKQIN